MHKIPVGRTISHAYGFAFKRYWTGLGIVWFPMLVLGALVFCLLPHIFEDYEGFFTNAMHLHAHLGQRFAIDENFVWEMQLLQYMLYFVFVVIGVGITKEVLGLRRGPRFIYAGIGAAELRAIACYFLLIVLTEVVFVAIVVFGAIFAMAIASAYGLINPHDHLQDAVHQWTVIWAIASACLVAVCVWIYVIVRLGYFLIPVAVAERRIGLERSWQLTRGNVLRISLIWIATALPLLIVQWLAMAALFVPLIIRVIVHHQSHPDIAQALSDISHSYSNYIGAYLLLGLVIAPIFNGLWRAPAAFAYRSLVPLAAPANASA